MRWLPILMPNQPNNIMDAELPLRARSDAGCCDAAAAAAAPPAPPQRPVPPHTGETVLRILQNEENRSEPLANVEFTTDNTALIRTQLCNSMTEKFGLMQPRRVARESK